MPSWIELLPPEVARSLMLPLLVRARVSLADRALFRDDLAVELVRRLELPDTAFTASPVETHAIMARTRLLDTELGHALHLQPFLTVINLGAGLDTRFNRVDNGRLLWYDLDLPDIIHVRNRLISKHERCRSIGCSLLDASWVLDIVRDDPRRVVVIADDLFTRLQDRPARKLLRLLARSFPDALLYSLVSKPKRPDERHDQPGCWGLVKVRDIERVDPRLTLERAWPIAELFPECQSGWQKFQNQFYFNRNNDQILRLRLSPKGNPTVRATEDG
jgi:O-methyltransferase involved in polyketide biosynthesis